MESFAPKHLTPEQIEQGQGSGLEQAEAQELGAWLNYGMARAAREWLEAELERLRSTAARRLNASEDR